MTAPDGSPLFSPTTERAYDRLPDVYRRVDASTGYTLKRWFSGIVDRLGELEDIRNRIDFVDAADRAQERRPATTGEDITVEAETMPRRGTWTPSGYQRTGVANNGPGPAYIEQEVFLQGGTYRLDLTFAGGPDRGKVLVTVNRDQGAFIDEYTDPIGGGQVERSTWAPRATPLFTGSKAAVDSWFADPPATIDTYAGPINDSIATANTARMWEGYVYCAEAGTWGFGFDSDDAADLTVNGTMVATFYSGRGLTDPNGYLNNGTVTIPAPGWYPFTFRVVNVGGGGGGRFGYRSPTMITAGTPAALVPASMLGRQADTTVTLTSDLWVPRGYHTLRVEWTGQRRDAALGTSINADRLRFVNLIANADDSSDLVDPNAADDRWLDWLAQLVGVQLQPGMSRTERRDAVRYATSGFRAGTKAAVGNAARSELTGTRFVAVFDHSTNVVNGIGTAGQWDVLIVTRTSETPPGADVVGAVIRKGAKPAGVRLYHRTYEASWDEIEDQRPTWFRWEQAGSWTRLEETGIDPALNATNLGPTFVE